MLRSTHSTTMPGIGEKYESMEKVYKMNDEDEINSEAQNLWVFHTNGTANYIDIHTGCGRNYMR